MSLWWWFVLVLAVRNSEILQAFTAAAKFIFPFKSVPFKHGSKDSGLRSCASLRLETQSLHEGQTWRCMCLLSQHIWGPAKASPCSRERQNSFILNETKGENPHWWWLSLICTYECRAPHTHTSYIHTQSYAYAQDFPNWQIILGFLSKLPVLSL